MAQKGMIAGPIVFLLGMNSLILGLKLLNEELGFRLSTSLADKMKGSLLPVSSSPYGWNVDNCRTCCYQRKNRTGSISVPGDGRRYFSRRGGCNPDRSFILLYKDPEMEYVPPGRRGVNGWSYFKNNGSDSLK